MKHKETMICILNANPLADVKLKPLLEAAIYWQVNDQIPSANNFKQTREVLKIDRYTDEIRRAVVECYITYNNERIQSSIVLP
jgi:hypothetical protein